MSQQKMTDSMKRHDFGRGVTHAHKGIAAGRAGHLANQQR